MNNMHHHHHHQVNLHLKCKSIVRLIVRSLQLLYVKNLLNISLVNVRVKKNSILYIQYLFCIGTVLVPSRPLPRTTVTHVHQAPRPPRDIIIERWCQPEKELVVVPPPRRDCPPLPSIVIKGMREGVKVKVKLRL